MKFILAVLLTATISFLVGLRLEWWSIAVVAFLVALLIPQAIVRSFVAGFLGIFVLWAVLAFWINSENGSQLAKEIAELFKIGSSSVLLVLITAFIGGVVGGFAAMAGSSLRPLKVRR
ncbi:MAG: hypothetical protein ACXVBX_11245 [Flavisolibacter sp.]